MNITTRRIATLSVAAIAAVGLAIGGSSAASAVSPPSGKASGGSAQKITATHTVPGAIVKVPRRVASDGTFLDSYSDPFTIDSSPAVTAVTSNVGATTESHEPLSLSAASGYQIYDTIWFTWKAPASGSLEADTFPSDSGVDTTLAVFTGSSMKSAKRIAFNDDAGGGVVHSQLRSLAITKGTTYHFQVGSSGPKGLTQTQANSLTGGIQLHIAGTFNPPSNDAQAHAKSESGSHWSSTGTTLGGTLEDSEPTANSVNSGSPRLGSVWWKWTASAGGTFDVTSAAKRVVGPRTQAYLAVFQQTEDGAYTQVFFSQGATISRSGVGIAAGATYYFQVGEVATYEGGDVTLSMTAHYVGPTITKVSPSHGSHNGGTTVTITGSRLGAVSHVYLGSADVNSFVSQSSSKIVLKTPAHAKGTVNVYAYGGGYFSTIAGKFLYTFT